MVTTVNGITPAALPKPVSPAKEPIINSPYRQPDWHWQLNSATKAICNSALPGRRLAQYIPPVAGSRNVQQTEDEGYGVEWKKLDLVNEIRVLVAAWQEAGYPGVTETTRRLIRHWTSPVGEDGGAYRYYFAQLDALLTHIYLKEAAPEQAGGQAVLRELALHNGKRNDDVDRIAHKMATGTGKTLTMAMLIVWHAANRNANPHDPRFVRRFLLLTPGLTVRERLEKSLLPNRPGNDYTEFTLLPPGLEWEHALNSAQILVVNEQQLDARKIGDAVSRVARTVMEGGSNPVTEQEKDDRTETPDDIARRVADSRSEPGGGKVLVINDEAHHCHRGDPRKLPQNTRDYLAIPTHMRDKDKDPRKSSQNTRWFRGLQYLRDAGLLHYVIDMSATPIYMVGSHKAPVEWIVSDYSLVDAIEAGLVKIPQVPTAQKSNDGSGPDPASAFRNIYRETETAHQKKFEPPNRANNTTLKEAFATLRVKHEELTESWLRTARDSQNERARIPVMAVVMNSVTNANAMFDYIASGQAGADLLCNYTSLGGEELRPEPRTIIVHSKIEEGKEATGTQSARLNHAIRDLADLYKRNPRYGFKPEDKPQEVIRRVMNTVGVDGAPGENVRCVVSVDMLTEGWDARTVTHILGFRAFDSSLLCEQVAGRTLRRVTRDFDYTGQRFTPEYAQILGIPFPQYQEPGAPDECPQCQQETGKCVCPPVSNVTIDYRSERPDLNIWWPNITQMRRESGEHSIRVVARSEGVSLHRVSEATPADPHIIEGLVGPEQMLSNDKVASRERFLFEVAGQATLTIMNDVRRSDDAEIIEETGGAINANLLFCNALTVLRQYYNQGFLTGPEERFSWPGDLETVAGAASWLALNVDIIKPTNGVVPVMQATPVAREPWLGVSAFRKYETADNKERIYGPAERSPLTHAHCDSSWERNVAGLLDSMPAVSRWVRNRNLNWHIPYVMDGEPHRYLPDFVAVVPLPNGNELHIVIEVKGQEKAADRVKRRWIEQYWLPAVNRHPDYGVRNRKVWDYLYLDSLLKVQSARDAVATCIAAHGVEDEGDESA